MDPPLDKRYIDSFRLIDVPSKANNFGVLKHVMVYEELLLGYTRDGLYFYPEVSIWRVSDIRILTGYEREL